MRSLSLARSLPLSLIGLTLAAGAGLAPACDTTATVFPIRVLFREARVAGVWPADAQGQRMCSDPGAATALVADALFLGTNRPDADPDTSIRPLDIVNFREVQGPSPDAIHLDASTLDLSLACREAEEIGGACTSSLPAAGLLDVAWTARQAERGQGRDVVVLLDMSASTHGLVDSQSLEEPSPTDVFDIPASFVELSSDLFDVRLAAAKQLLATLVEEDRADLIAFREGDLDLELDLKEVEEAWSDFEPVGSEGRAPLWSAIRGVWDQLGEGPVGRPAHLILLSDGADSCDPETLPAEDLPCVGGEVSASTMLAELGSYGGARPLFLHIVQLGSPTHPEADPLQVKAACLGGGQYHFVDGTAMAQEQSTLQEALGDTVADLRHGLAGRWALHLPLGAALGATTTGSEPPLALLTGTLVVRADSNMVPTDRPEVLAPSSQPFAPGPWLPLP